jgi:hypothetical protein
MNSLERVRTALQGGQPDRVPIMDFVIDPKVARAAVPGCTERGRLHGSVGHGRRGLRGLL